MGYQTQPIREEMKAIAQDRYFDLVLDTEGEQYGIRIEAGKIIRSRMDGSKYSLNLISSSFLLECNFI
jgi:hypothetical protein